MFAQNRQFSSWLAEAEWIAEGLRWRVGVSPPSLCRRHARESDPGEKVHLLMRIKEGFFKREMWVLQRFAKRYVGLYYQRTHEFANSAVKSLDHRRCNQISPADGTFCSRDSKMRISSSSVRVAFHRRFHNQNIFILQKTKNGLPGALRRCPGHKCLCVSEEA